GRSGVPGLAAGPHIPHPARRGRASPRGHPGGAGAALDRHRGRRRPVGRPRPGAEAGGRRHRVAPGRGGRLAAPRSRRLRPAPEIGGEPSAQPALQLGPRAGAGPADTTQRGPIRHVPSGSRWFQGRGSILRRSRAPPRGGFPSVKLRVAVPVVVAISVLFAVSAFAADTPAASKPATSSTGTSKPRATKSTSAKSTSKGTTEKAAAAPVDSLARLEQ